MFGFVLGVAATLAAYRYWLAFRKLVIQYLEK